MDRIIVCILSALFASASFAYPTPVDLDGALHYWPITTEAPNVYFEIKADDSLIDVLTEISLNAADKWSSVEQSLLEVKKSDEANPPQITINFKTSISGGDMAAGYSIFDDVKDGVPVHCSITIAADPYSDPYNLTKTTTHEMGHCLGLGHSLIPDSIMSYSLEKNSTSLSADDKAAISRLYPLNGSTPKLAPGCSIGGKPRENQPNILFYLIFFGPLLLSAVSKIMRYLVKN